MRVRQDLYGKPAPLTGVCAACSARVKIKKDGTVWRHRRKPNKPAACQGSGVAPKLGTAKQKWPAKAAHRSVQAVSGGIVESNRRRH
jgi:hypothetical protein